MGHRYVRLAETKTKQKIRSDKNKLKIKPKKFASESVKARKLELKEVKRQKFLSKK